MLMSSLKAWYSCCASCRRWLGSCTTRVSSSAWINTSSYRSVKACTVPVRSEEHTSELQSLMRISYAVFCLKKKKQRKQQENNSVNILSIKRNTCVIVQEKHKMHMISKKIHKV